MTEEFQYYYHETAIPQAMEVINAQPELLAMYNAEFSQVNQVVCITSVKDNAGSSELILSNLDWIKNAKTNSSRDICEHDTVYFINPINTLTADMHIIWTIGNLIFDKWKAQLAQLDGTFTILMTIQPKGNDPDVDDYLPKQK